MGNQAPSSAPEPARTPQAVPPASGRRTPSTFWWTLWLAVALAAMKGSHLEHLVNPPFKEDEHSYFDDFCNLSVVSRADVVYSVGLGLTATVLLRLARVGPLRRLRWLGRGVWGTFLSLCALSVLYGAASVVVFKVLRMPLTYTLLYLANDVRNMSSSVAAYLTPLRVSLVLALPAAYCVLCWFTSRVLPPRPTRRWRGAKALLALAVLDFLWLGGRTRDEWMRWASYRLVESPHWALVRSTAAHLLATDEPTLKESFPPDYLQDFRQVRERGAAPPNVGPKPPVRNVILVVLESVGSRYLGVYGSPYPTTPRLRAEAANAIVFDRAYAQQALTPAETVVLTLSEYPGLWTKFLTVEEPAMPGDSLAQVLKGRGFRTAFLSSGDNDFSNIRGFLSGRGFDDLRDYRDLGGEKLVSWGGEDRKLFDSALAWIDREAGRPFFLMLWTIQNHHPYPLSRGQPLSRFEGGDAGAAIPELQRYLTILQEEDRQLARLLDGLRGRGLADETLVVITGDHGEVFGPPHGTYMHPGLCYEEDTHVPLIFWNPRLAERGTRSDVLCGHIDVLPTVCDLLGISQPPSWRGHSVFDPSRPPRVYIYGHTDHRLCVREGNWKYLFKSSLGTEELYDLRADPEEQHDVARENADLCTGFRRRLSAWISYEGGQARARRGR